MVARICVSALDRGALPSLTSFDVPAHIAAACGVPNISLFDPRRNNLPARWQPLGTGVVLRPEVPTCEKCIYEACPYWDCLDRITVDTVVQHVREVTSRSFPLRVVHV